MSGATRYTRWSDRLFFLFFFTKVNSFFFTVHGCSFNLFMKVTHHLVGHKQKTDKHSKKKMGRTYGAMFCLSYMWLMRGLMISHQ